MRLHVNSLYALMLLILIFNIPQRILCEIGKVQKRAIDFDEVADFADIIEPEYTGLALPPVKKEVKATSIDSGNLGNVLAPSDTSPSRKTDMERVLNFRMRQYKQRARRKRLVHYPISISNGRTFLGNLADETKDIRLKMNSFAENVLINVNTSPQQFVGTPSPDRDDKVVEVRTVSNTASTNAENPQSEGRAMVSRATASSYTKSSGTVHSSRGADKRTQITKPTTHSTVPSTVGNIYEDEPLLGADGFYAEFENHVPLSNQRKVTVPNRRKRFIYTDFGITNFDQLLKVYPISDEESQSYKNVRFVPSPSPIYTTHLTTQPAKVSTVTTSIFPTSAVSFPITKKYTVTTISKATNLKTTSRFPTYSNPYNWENDLIKEIGVKYKKELPTTVALVGHIAKRANSETHEPVYNVSLADGKTASIPVCHGKACEKLQQTFMVYNDSNGDCNKEPEESVGEGGYNIISNDDDDKTTTSPPPVHICPFDHVNITTTTTTEKTKGDPDSPCESKEENDICDTILPDDEKKKSSCKGNARPHKKHKAKNKLKGKRQVFLTTPVPVTHAVTTQPCQQGQFLPPDQLVVLASPTTSLPEVSATSMIMPKITKKSMDKCALSAIIENLKIVDQKLADAVDPLHSAQEQLDMANSEKASTSLMSDLSDEEKSALQRLAVKIMCQNKSKRADVPDVDKNVKPSELFNPTTLKAVQQNDYDYVDSARINNRLQRDLSVAQEIEAIIEQLRKRDSSRQKRNLSRLTGISNAHINDEDGNKSDRGEGADEYHGGKKKIKPKKIWRKLFGFTNNKREQNRFLDQDIQNSQSIKDRP